MWDIVAEESEKQFNCLRENIEKYIIFSVPIKEEVTRIDKKEKKSQRLYLADYHLLTAQDLLQGPYQILLVLLLKEFIKLNVNMSMIMKNARRLELNTKNVSAVFNIQR